MDDDLNLSAAPDPSAEPIELELDSSPDDHDAPLDAGPDDEGYINLDADSDEPADSAPPARSLTAEDAAALRAEADELRRNIAQLEQERNRERAELARLDEDNRLRQIEADYRQGLAAVRREAANHADPEGFIAEYTARWGDWRLNEREAILQNRLNQTRQAYTRASIPNFAQRVAREVGLTEEEAQDLLDYRPEQMVAEARKMVRNRSKQESEIASLTKQLDQIKREVAARNSPAASVTPGTGRGPTRRVKAGSLDHLSAIFEAAAR